MPFALEGGKQCSEAAKQRQVATLKQNQATDRAILPEREKGQARDQAAEMGDASPRYIQDAKQIAKDAPEILDHVQHGTRRIPHATQVAGEDSESFVT